MKKGLLDSKATDDGRNGEGMVSSLILTTTCDINRIGFQHRRRQLGTRFVGQLFFSMTQFIIETPRQFRNFWRQLKSPVEIHTEIVTAKKFNNLLDALQFLSKEHETKSNPTSDCRKFWSHFENRRSFRLSTSRPDDSVTAPKAVFDPSKCNFHDYGYNMIRCRATRAIRVAQLKGKLLDR